MDRSFRSRYEQRGRAFELQGERVGDLSREELLAVIGYLLSLSDERGEARAAGEQPLGSPPGAETGRENPPKNDGLYEG